MRKSFCLIPLLTVLVAAGLPAQDEERTGPQAQEEFEQAYLLLTQADRARDAQRFSVAIELYRRALDRYIELANTYPDWQPGVIRFRLSYCDNQLKALLRSVEEGTIKLRSSRGGGPGPAAGQAPEGTPQEVRPALREATGYLVEGRAADAKRVLLEVLKNAPDNITVRLLIGVAQCQARRFDDAVFLLENLVEEMPDHADAHVILGTAYFALNREDDAVEQMSRALEINPSHKEAHFNLARILLSRKPPEIDKAREHYHKALSLGASPDPDMSAILGSS